MNGHVLYTPKDFTDEEYHEGNQLAVMVIDGGLGVCKQCGAAEIELDRPCKRGENNSGTLIIREPYNPKEKGNAEILH